MIGSRVTIWLVCARRRVQAMAAFVPAVLILTGATVGRADLTTFGYGNARLGSAPAGVGVSPARARHLRVIWRARVGGAINDQPLVVDGLWVGRRRRDVAFVGSEHGDVIALDAARGTVLWHRHVETRSLEPDCGAVPDGRFGVTGTMAIDRGAERLYAVDVGGLAWAFSLTDGKVVRGWPVRVHLRGPDFVWGGLAIARGRLYVSIASLCDTGHYNGGIDAIDLAHPSQITRWLTTGAGPAYGGGIWGWGGVSIDRATGDVYAATGNAIGGTAETDGDSEAIVRLSPGLARLEADQPLVPPYAIYDRDFGTTPILLDPPGCGHLLVAINKVGALYVYSRNHVAAGPTKTLLVAAPTASGIPLYGMPAYDPATRTLVLVSPSGPSSGPLHAGVQAFTITHGCELALKWQQSFDAPDAGSAPTVADGVVYIGSGRNGWLRAFRLSDGARVWGGWLKSGTIFAAPSVDLGTVYVGTWDGALIALRPNR